MRAIYGSILLRADLWEPKGNISLLYLKLEKRVNFTDYGSKNIFCLQNSISQGDVCQVKEQSKMKEHASKRQ